MNGLYQRTNNPSDQNYFVLLSIQSASLGLPAVLIGEQLTRQFGAGIAICSILIGNLFLWLIGMTIISMAIQDRTNAIQNVRNYLGKYSGIFMGAVLVVAFLNWFQLQVNTSVPSIGRFFDIEDTTTLIRIGAGLGFFTALLAMWGIQLIKWITTLSLPGLFLYYVYSVIQSDYSITTIQTWGISFPAIVSTILVLLPGAINLPTFFRHARSKADCYLALTIMTLLISFFEISTIWMDFTPSYNVIFPNPTYSIFRISTLIFIVLTLLCTNLLNIYFASACLETYLPRFEGAKGYAIIGLMGTATYTFIQVNAPIQFIASLANSYLSTLGTVLLISYLIRVIVKHRPRKFEKAINGFCWLIGCAVATFFTVKNTHDGIHPLLLGSAVSAATFLLIVFIEENIWATRKLLLNR